MSGLKKSKMAFVIQSSQESVEAAILEARHFLHQQNVEQSDKAELVLRELLLNAIRHGNHSQPHLTVYCEIQYDHEPHRITMVVRDKGTGFDLSRVETSLRGDPRYMQKRGYRLIKALCSDLELSDSGNEVTARMYLDATPAGLLSSSAQAR